MTAEHVERPAEEKRSCAAMGRIWQESHFALVNACKSWNVAIRRQPHTLARAICMQQPCDLPSRPRVRNILAALAVWLALSVALVHSALPIAQPIVQPLLSGKWPAWPSGMARDVKVRNNFAYVAQGSGGMAVFDVSNPTNCVQVGGYDTSGESREIALVGNYAYVADGTGGLQVIDVSNPYFPTYAGIYDL